MILTHAATNAFQGPWSAGLALLPEAARGVDPHLLVLVPQVALSALIVWFTRGRLGLASTPRARMRTGRLAAVLARLGGGLAVLGATGALV